MQLTGWDDVTPNDQHIFLSPHFDDAVYSCGGTLGTLMRNGYNPLVVTVFAGMPPADVQLSPYALQTHREMGFDQTGGSAVTIRRAEDTRALEVYHARGLWLDYLDAIYRGSPALYVCRQHVIGGDVRAEDRWISQRLAHDLLAVHEHLPDTVWYCPLGVGRHVDHQIVSDCAKQLIETGANVRLYEDFPYIMYPGALDERLREWEMDLSPIVVDISATFSLRQLATGMYASQIRLEKDAIYSGMDSYTRSISPARMAHTERYWTDASKLRSSDGR